jgi:hypothetical protein
MRHPRLVTIAAVALALLAGGRAAYAQERFEFKIPFAFVANGKTLPAGDYYFYADDLKQVLTVESKSSKGTQVFMPIETRISERKGPTDAELVFDKVNDQSLVAELLPPDVDGYVLLVTKTKHTHHSLFGARAKK